MKITSKGQVTIPQHLREKTGIVPGSDVEFSEKNGKLFLKKTKRHGRGKKLVERMRGHGNVRMSTDEILALTRGAK